VQTTDTTPRRGRDPLRHCVDAVNLAILVTPQKIDQRAGTASQIKNGYVAPGRKA
jgi:hypothetical protein